MLVLLAVVALLVTGCKGAPADKLEPKVSPPAIKTAGTLKIGVDLSYPPFGGTDQGKQAGLDLDVAAALASQLGLTATFVAVKPSEAATALADGRVDLVLSVPFSEEGLTRTSLAGSYISDGPAFFVATDSTASVVPSITLETLTAPKVGAQQGSPAYWKLAGEIGEDSIVAYPTLREALTALQQGQVPLVAGDALVGAYIIRDMPTVHFAGQVEPAMPLGAAVGVDNTVLGDAVRTSLDSMAADGVLDAIRSKWVGNLPKLAVPASADSSGSVEPTAAP
jgi:polar amino acid transport system substrate-binding protein